MAQCKKFAIEKMFMCADGEVFTKAPHRDTPLWIIAWIMDVCDVIHLDASPKLSTDTPAMTYVFGCVHGLGSLAWHERDDGTMQGNPSILNQVSAYMLSLCRRKVHAGETATSACAITQYSLTTDMSDILKDLYDFNHHPENWKIKQYSPGKCKNAADPEEEVPWAGRNTCQLLFAAFTIIYLCLLRVDEVLKIKFSHLKWDTHDDNQIVLTLPFQKTSQNGNIKPFVLHRLPDYFQHLCPVCALCDWILASQLSSGYVFRKMLSGDRFSTTDIAMTSEQFLKLFRNSLLDIRLDPYPYGTHSFRRGGCQFLHGDLRWSLRRLCDWGGWSTDFTHLTIVKYLISWNDEPGEKREDFLNLERPPSLKCPSCGRSCQCAY
ncbi:DNA breaking-rejoining enzyme [Pleurotus eryngii]|uniref:DNA breaking-rejoining enzyme n=1 Tax=Pleurotus eryngii TaxID=5323 RepID=A0A9P5ZIP9_PLEER|nr:DNA breaking-rejoining enzyme [Pleurotus eryngii]